MILIINYWCPFKIEDIPFIAVSDTYNSPARRYACAG